MKILFVCSGNNKFGISPIVKNQGESLKANFIDIDYFAIKGKGILGYLKNIFALIKYTKQNNYHLIHAHYALCGWVSILPARLSRNPIILSYMGSDLYGGVDENGKRERKSYLNIVLSQLLQPFVQKIVVKSKNMENYIFLKRKVSIIPNGVNFAVFKCIDKKISLKNLNLSTNQKLILFLGNPTCERKNIKLLTAAIDSISDKNIRIVAPYPIPFNDVVLYLNAADVLVLTSYLEGSPNVIKEAMACNLPIVSTDVGDVKEVIGYTEGCYICKFDQNDVADKIRMAIENGKRTNGRENIKHLDSNVTANKIIHIYKEVLRNK